jgi:RNA polymerase sigma-70 factor (ECF subfamily)
VSIGLTGAVTEEGMDTDLVESAQHGDKGAFTSLAAALPIGSLPRRRILRDMSLAEDATQQALLTVWQELPQLRDPARFDAWSYRILVRACYAEAKRTRRWTPNIHLLPADEPVAPDGLGSVVECDQLERGFRRLSLDHRMVVVMHHYLDLPLDQVAEIIGIPVGTVASRLHHAMRGLRAALDADARRLRERLRMSTDRDVTASFGRGCTRTLTRTPTASSTSSSMRSTRPHSARPRGWRRFRP